MKKSGRHTASCPSGLSLELAPKSTHLQPTDPMAPSQHGPVNPSTAFNAAKHTFLLKWQPLLALRITLPDHSFFYP